VSALIAGGTHPAQTIINQGPLTPKTVNWLDTHPVVGPATRWITHKISRGDTLSRIWQEYGASTEGASRAAKALSEVNSQAARLQYGEEIELKLSEDGRIEGVKKRTRDGAVIVLEGTAEEGFNSQVIQPQIVETVQTASGVISSSFSAAAVQIDVPYSVVDDYVDLFSSRVEFERALQPGDTFSIQYTQRRTADGEILEPGPIQAASMMTGGKMLVAIRHESSAGKASYFDEEGNALGNYFLRYPLQFTRISSTISDSRFHPVLKRHRPHKGVDFAAPTGTPVRSVADGVIEFAGWINGGGNTIRIRHSERWTTVYMHLSKIASEVKKGARVSRGQFIGGVGSTGFATGPHLHFELHDRGQYVNPLTTATPQMPQVNSIPKDLLLATLNTLRAAHAELEQSGAPTMVAGRSVPEQRRKV
jgi:murein DD-endopeptidase MepM/ murein hydrolase activator NlpD